MDELSWLSWLSSIYLLLWIVFHGLSNFKWPLEKVMTIFLLFEMNWQVFVLELQILAVIHDESESWKKRGDYCSTSIQDTWYCYWELQPSKVINTNKRCKNFHYFIPLLLVPNVPTNQWCFLNIQKLKRGLFFFSICRILYKYFISIKIK